MTQTGLPGEPRIDELAGQVDAYFAQDPGLVRCPHDLYRRLRDEQPVCRHRDTVLVSRYRQARQVLTSSTIWQGLSVRGTRYRNAASKSDARRLAMLEEIFAFYEQRVGGTNGERHARLRGLAQKAFTPRVVAGMEERIAAIVDDLLRALPTDTQIDLVGDFAYHLPLIVICEMLDIPVDDREKLHAWSNDLGQFVGVDWGTTDTATLERMHDSLFSLRTYLGAAFASHRGGSTTDLLGAFLAAEGDGGDRFTEDELVATITQFVFAGHETTTSLIASAVTLLAGEHRDQWDLLCREPARITGAIEEVLRFEPPTKLIDKLAAEERDIADVHVDQWQTVSVVLAACNRDAEIAEDADRFDITRPSVTHISFGVGPHFCIGASLARLEAATALRALTSRFPSLRVVPGELHWRPNHMIRSLAGLPVVLGRPADN